MASADTANPPVLEEARLELCVRRLADALLPGLDPSLSLGRGLEYAGSRPWADGDNRRDIDWRVSARRARLHVREYDSLRGMPVALVVDGSASMHAGIGPTSKYQVACAIAGALAVASLRRNSSVTMVGLGIDGIAGRSTRSRGHVLADLARLLAASGQDLEANLGLAHSLHHLAERLQRRHLLILCSDCHGNGLVEALHRLHQAHDCVVLRPLDAAEHSPPRIGLCSAIEAETGAGGVSRGLPGCDWQGPLRRLGGLGIDHLALPIEQDWVLPLRRFLRDRAHGRGR